MVNLNFTNPISIDTASGTDTDVYTMCYDPN